MLVEICRQAMTENAYTQAEAALVADIVNRVNVAKSYFLEEPAISDFIAYRVSLELTDIGFQFESQRIIQLVKERLNNQTTKETL
jgi:hypothetical protein